MSVSVNLLPANTSGMETDVSGWTAGANTTLSQSTRFYLGSKSLALTATAAGTVTATTAARVAITAGTTYQLYGFFANVVAAAGRTSAVRVDWYSVSTGGTAISSVTGTATTLTNDTAWNTPPPQAIVTAPAGATYASLTISVTGLTAAAVVVADAMALGTPNVVADNMLSYNSSSVEQDTSGWGAWANVTLGRSTAAAWEGWYSLLLTAVASGDVASGQATSLPVTVGTEYLAYVMARADAAGTFRLDLRWYDASDVFMTQTTATWTLAANTWVRCNVVATAPPGAAGARVRLRPAATAAGQTWLCDQMVLKVAPGMAGNLLSYNVADMEMDISGWTGAHCTLSQSADHVASGGYALKAVADGTGDMTITIASRVPVTPGLGYQLRPPIWRPVDRNYWQRLDWYNADGQIIRTRQQEWTGPLSVYAQGSSGDLAPSAAVTLSASIVVVGAPAGETWYFDKVFVGLGGLTVDASPSGGGGATVTVRGLTTGGAAWTWTLSRMLADGSMTPVRGWAGDLVDQTPTGDVAVIVDYEAPLGVPVQWYVRSLRPPAEGVGSLDYTSDTLVLSPPTDGQVWIKDPGLPARAAEFVVGALPAWQRSARQGVNAVRGRARPIVISDARSARTGTLSIVTATDEDRATLWWLLDPGSTLLMQWPPGWGEGDTYVQVGDVTETRAASWALYQDREWTLALTEVDRPAGGVTGSPGRTWQTVNDNATDWFAVMTGSASWLGVLTGGG